MIFEDDETLRMYVEESLEHLSNIESDLLLIEGGGAEIDPDVVNNVFRAAHSIKGGTGFMGLSNIKELSHKLENILGMIRSREMVPTPGIISTLLKSFDMLTELISNAENSNEMDIASHIEALVGLATDSLPVEKKAAVSQTVQVLSSAGRSVLEASVLDVDRARNDGKFIYLVEYDLIHDIQRRDKTPLELITSLVNTGVILESKVDVMSVGDLDADIPNRIPFYILYASIVEPEIISTLFDVEEKYIRIIGPDDVERAIEGGASLSGAVMGVEEAAAPQKAPPVEPAAPPPPPEPAPSKPPVRVEPPAPAPAAPVLESVEEEPAVETAQAPPSMEIKSQPAQTSLRVNVSLLDTLMTLAGELVLSRNQLLQAIAAGQGRVLELTGQRIDMVTSELQEAIMRTRMQPIANVFGKFPRVVRDIARDLGKEIELIIEGKGVELDKTIIEAINDPLTHLVRNAADHGVEPPDERKRLGKNPVGKLKLRAYHAAGQVNIEISDDGRGLDGEKLAASALKKGLLNESQIRSMSEKEKINLIFLPGFSTAKTVTDVSGRGVGMDVVKTNLDRLGGIVDIESVVGEGTTIRIKLPLTLAIIPSQIISVCDERYAIPQVNLNELLRIPADQVKERIERVGDAQVVRLRGHLLPLLRLSEVLGMAPSFTDPETGEARPDRRQSVADRRSRQSPMFRDSGEEAAPKAGEEQNARSGEDRRFHAASAINIAVVSAGAFKYGLVVDRLRDSEEIVVKPLGRHLMDCKGYAGATIMGDGKVALILDVVGLAQMAGLTSLEGTDRAQEVAGTAVRKTETGGERASLLLFRNHEKEQFAVPLNLVERVERIRSSDIESVGGKKVMQYRGGSLPLFGIEEVANVKPRAERDQVDVIVFSISGKEVGLLAVPPIDAVDADVALDDVTLAQTGVLGSAIINAQTTLMVDVHGVVKALNPGWFSEERARRAKGPGSSAFILFAEDSAFFRSQVTGFLEESGWAVIEAEDGLEAWELLAERAEEIRLVLTDLEMPNMDGFELTSRIKNDDRFSHLPVVALTSLAGEEDVAKGRRAGIDDYQFKLDKETLVETVRRFMA